MSIKAKSIFWEVDNKRIIEEKNKRTTSFVNDSHGVSLIASPKQPQSVTLL